MPHAFLVFVQTTGVTLTGVTVWQNGVYTRPDCAQRALEELPTRRAHLRPGTGRSPRPGDLTTTVLYDLTVTFATNGGRWRRWPSSLVTLAVAVMAVAVTVELLTEPVVPLPPTVVAMVLVVVAM